MSDNPDQSQFNDLSGMTAWVLTNDDHIRSWQADALAMALDRGLCVTAVLQCDPQPPQRRPLRHLGYRLLQRRVRRAATQSRVPWRSIVGKEAVIGSITSGRGGGNARILAQTGSEIESLTPDVVINFGLQLEGDPGDEPLLRGVMSFSHFNPTDYCVDTTAFYEVLQATSHVGAIVTRPSTTKGQREVLASSSHQVVAHSYAKTIDGLYRNSAHLLVKALLNDRRVDTTSEQVLGAEPSVPRNGLVLRFTVALARRKVSRFIYGATRTKKWRVGRTQDIIATTDTGTVALDTPEDVDVPAGFQFLADPLPGPNDTIWCEAMDSKTGLGRILVLSPGAPPEVADPPGTKGLHLAYPFVVESDGITYLIPEMSAAAPARIFTLDGNTPVDPRPLLGLEQEHLVDPTFHHQDGRWWLFAGIPGTAGELLWLWSAPEIFGSYEPHPANPIVMDPSRARSGGPLFVSDGKLLRPGQNNSGAYGNGLTLCEVTELSMQSYVEVPRIQIRVISRNGPHTLVRKSDHLVVDSYIDIFDPLAWLHRLRNRD